MEPADRPRLSTADVCRLAQNLARNCGYAVLPCGDDKRPTLKDWPERASADPDVIAKLWRSHAGPLIGIVTGSRSGVSVLDVDPKHPEAFVWWQDSHPLLLPARTYQTRSGGLHLYFRHREGVTNSQSKICRGVDTRGEGGCIIAWFAAGFDCFDHTPPQPWPAWLIEELTRRPPTPPPIRHAASSNSAIDGIVSRLAASREGERNAVLFWSACRCAERGMRQREIEALLIPTAIGIGLSDHEARRTIASAQRARAVA
jgi:hypothetical protein